MSDTNIMDEVKRDAGRVALERDRGYNSIPLADVKQREEKPAVENTPDNLRAAAATLVRNRDEAAPTVVKRAYQDADPEVPDALAGPETGHEVLKQLRAPDAEKAALDADLDSWALGDAIDEHRGVERMTDRVAREWEEQQAQEQRQVQAQHREQQAAEQARQQQAAQAQHAASPEAERHAAPVQGAVASLLADFPEIPQDLPANQLGNVIAALQQRNQPQRAAQLQQRIRTLESVYGQQVQHSQRMQHHAQQQHTQYVANEERALAQSISKDFAAASATSLCRRSGLVEANGINPVEYANLARGGGQLGDLLASRQVMSLLYAASAAMLDGKGRNSELADLKAKLVRDVPPVVRGGYRSDAPAPSNGPSNQRLAAALNGAKGDNALKIATQLLLNRRAGG